MFSPAPQPDRIAELENTVRRLEAALEGSRRAGAETVIPQTLRTARTATRDPEDEDTTVYPRSYDARRLPIVFTDWVYDPPPPAAENDESTITVTPRSEYPLTHAMSPLWLPPEIDVDVAWTGNYWRIVRWPSILVGKVITTGIETAEWDSGSLTPGWSRIHIYRENEDGDYAPQYYDEEETDEVYMWVLNTCGEISGRKLLTVSWDADNEPHVIVEPCSLTDSGS